jgi:hypothetical protein
MRMHPILVLAVGLVSAACDDSGGPSTDGTLVVSTSTGGSDPDQDGYLLTIHGLDSLALDPTGTAELALRAGQHTLQLLGVAEHCSATPATSLEVDVPPEGTTPVAFVISCPASAARITTTTTGLDIDPDGYRVVVDGTDRGTIPSNGTALTRLNPGSRTIALTDLAPNCTIDGPGSRTVTIGDPEVVPIEVAVVCTATTGVIGILLEASGTDVNGVLGAMVDGAEPFIVGPGAPAYLTGVSGGDHVVSLVGPANCSVETDPQSVTVIVGQLIRDTVEVDFSVTCAARGTSGTVRITAPTTGPIPSSTRYHISHESFGYWDYGGTSTFLGVLAPNDTLVAELPVSNEFSGADPYWYSFELRGIPANCSVQDDPHPYPLPGFTITFGDTLDIEYPVACSP